MLDVSKVKVFWMDEEVGVAAESLENAIEWYKENFEENEMFPIEEIKEINHNEYFYVSEDDLEEISLIELLELNWDGNTKQILFRY